MGVLPTTNLGISAIRQEVITNSGAMSTIGSIADPYIPGNQYAMSSYRGWQLPISIVTSYQNDGGIWDGCNYWDVFCYMEGNDPILGQYTDPYFGYIGAYWSQNSTTFNTERGSNNGTELTFGGGYCEQQVHGRTTLRLHNVMIPQYAGFCTTVHLSIWVNGSRVACTYPNSYDYTDLTYDLYCNPGTNYTVNFNVNYGFC